MKKILPLLLFGLPGLTASADRPNIIFIMSDDHSMQTISAYGGLLKDFSATKNIDRLAKSGMMLTNAFCTNSISTPSRAAILTGRYAHKNGVYTLNDILNPQLPTSAKMLQSAGYATGIIGKWHLKSEPQGFDYYCVLPGQGVYENPRFKEKTSLKEHFEIDKGIEVNGYSTDIIGDKAVEWISKQDSTKPFMLMCHFKAPHRNWIPAERFRTLFEDCMIPEPHNLLDNYEGKGNYTDFIRMGLEHMKVSDVKQELPQNISRDELRKWAYQIYMKDYLRCVAGVDENVGKILDYLDKCNLTENTIVIYTSDQGFFMGEHGWFDKRLMYDQAIKMPFLIRYPKEIAANTVNNDFILNIDFAPTLLDFAEVFPEREMQGKSFRKILNQNQTSKDWRKSIYYRYWMNDDVAHHVPAHMGVRNNRYKLILFYKQSLGKTGTGISSSDFEWEFYDLINDPEEMTNLYYNPAYAKHIADLKRELLMLRAEYEDEDLDFPGISDMIVRNL
ncbi:MAG: sulfatase [Bacteroidales bacterium]